MTSGQPLDPVRSERRPVFLTRLAWVFIAVGALGLPMSVLALFMVMAGSPGNGGESFFGGIVVIGGPPSALAAGIGLLRLRAWAHRYAVALVALVAANGIRQLVRGSTPEVATVAPDGTITTQLASSIDYPWHVLTVCIALGLAWKLLSPAMRAQFSRRKQMGTHPISRVN